MSTRTDDDSGSDLLLFVALQVSTEWTSSRLKFCITISLRVTPLLGVVVRLLTNLSLRYQDTIGAGLPTETGRSRFSSLPVSRAEKKYYPGELRRFAWRKLPRSKTRVRDDINGESTVSLVRAEACITTATRKFNGTSIEYHSRLHSKAR